MSRRRLLLVIWVALAALSNLVRLRQPEPAPDPDVETTLLRAVDGEVHTAAPLRFAWRDWAGSDPGATPVVLIHGSPGDHSAMVPLAESLDTRRRRLAVDLPGFGSSTRDVPDYSVRAHAITLLDWLAQAVPGPVHLVVHSMGGGVAIEAADRAPDRIASVTLIAAIGAQEYEMFGSYAANHAVHGVQLWFFRALLWGLPHFGWLDNHEMGLSYARNFYDTDQRPLRPALLRYQGPMLIVHGEHDFLVPVEAAREHARLVPQSEVHIDEGDHFDIFRRGGPIGPVVDSFLDRVDRGEARTRAAALADRVTASAAPFDPATLPRAQGPTLLILGALLALATLVSEDLACITAGLLVAEGRMGFIGASLACFIGIFVGDLLLLAAGRWLGRPILKLPPLVWWVREEAVDRMSRWYTANGATVIFTSRFMPGARLPMYVAAGLLKTPALRFAGLFAIAAGVWTPLLVGFSAVAGEQAMDLVQASHVSPALGLALAVVLVVVLRAVVPLTTWRGRRLALGWWRRQTHWEFWPMARFYPPVFAWLAWLCVRHRSLTLYTAVNPGMPLGGIVDESKRDIYARLGGNANPRIPRTTLLPAALSPDARVEAARAFLAEHGLGWPVVLKPDTGQRGQGVAIVRSDAAMEAYLRATREDVLVQEHVGGVEYGLFYVRRPSEPQGWLFSITWKKPLDVVGDGASTLERLILADDRAVCMAPTHLRVWADQLDRVPAAGERVRLVEIGTHSRGSVFLDGSDVRTPALEAAVDALSKRYEGGVYFGRYDVRAESVEALKRGEFKVIELNGATSEAVHIYDPKNSVFYAWRTLFQQWALCFEIAAANAREGAPVATPGEIWRAWRAYQAKERARGRA